MQRTINDGLFWCDLTNFDYLRCEFTWYDNETGEEVKIAPTADTLFLEAALQLFAKSYYQNQEAEAEAQEIERIYEEIKHWEEE